LLLCATLVQAKALPMIAWRSDRCARQPPLGCSARIGYKHRRVAWPLGNLAPGIARSETASAAAINSRTD